MSIASVADSDMNETETEIVAMLEKYKALGGGDNEEFRQAMKLHLALLLQVVRNTDDLQKQVEAFLRDDAKE